MKDDRALDQQRRVGVGVVGDVGWPLGDGDVVGFGGEPGVLGHRHRGAIDREPIHLDLANGFFLRIEAGRAHPEPAARQPDRIADGHAG
jgi:hypothetical protein